MEQSNQNKNGSTKFSAGLLYSIEYERNRRGSFSAVNSGRMNMVKLIFGFRF
jgi:hypothetical protein